MIRIILALAVGLNLLTFATFGFDKWMARSRSWRVPEAVLWFLTLIGGSVGAIAGMQFFRHKTRKLSFQLVIVLILLLQVAGVGAVLYYLNI